MPLYKRRTTKKRTIKRKRITRRKRSGLVRGVHYGSSLKANAASAFDPLPNVMRAKFMYVRNTTGSSIAGQLTGENYRMNACFTPFAGSGNTCQNWGIASSNYSSYIVNSCRFIVTFSDPSTDGFTVGIIPNFYNKGNILGIANGMDYLLASKEATYKDLNNSGSQVTTFTKTFYPWQFAVPFKSRYYNDEAAFSALTSTNPSFMPYVSLFWYHGNNTNTVNMKVIIEYDVTLYDRKV